MTMMIIRKMSVLDTQAWTVAEAKAKFSEVIDKGKSTGSQTITQGNLAEFFAASPLRGSGTKVKRLKGRPRKVDL